MLQRKVPPKPEKKYKSNKPCLSFNSIKGCYFKNGDCNYKHVCKSCKSPDHNIYHCPSLGPMDVVVHNIIKLNYFNKATPFGHIAYNNKKYCLSYQNKGICNDSIKGIACYLRHFCYICNGDHPAYKCKHLNKENKFLHICQKFNRQEFYKKTGWSWIDVR